MPDVQEIRPQEGPQSQFLSTPADIAIYGGAAGGGKTWAILAEPLRHVSNPKFHAMIFRREGPMITNPGALWDASAGVYPMLGARSNITMMRWIFPSKATIRFSSLEHEDDKNNWQGSEIPFIGFDELTHFTSTQFFYLLSRNRSMCGVRPYVRATCNPDATSWVKSFLAPWIDKLSPLKAESGEILYMLRRDDVIYWYKTMEEAIDDNAEWLSQVPVDPKDLVKSVTFIKSTIYDNKLFLKQDPGYLGSLLALPYVERMRLLEGDWDVLPEAGKVFDRSWFEIIDKDALPSGGENKAYDVRFWDFAATEKKQKGDDPDWTVGTLMRKVGSQYYVRDIVRFRLPPGKVEQAVLNTATQDGHEVPVRWEQEGGSSGKIASNVIATKLDGYDASYIRPMGDKVVRAKPMSSAAEQNRIKLVKAEWNEGWLTELHHFPDMDHDDCVDSATYAYTFLSRYAGEATVGEDLWSS